MDQVYLLTLGSVKTKFRTLYIFLLKQLLMLMYATEEPCNSVERHWNCIFRIMA